MTKMYPVSRTMGRKKRQSALYIRSVYYVLYSLGALKSVRSKLIPRRFGEVCKREWSSHTPVHLF